MVYAHDTYRPPTPLGLDEYYFVPEGNPITRDKIALGERLFFDKRLSSDRRIACASCHRPEHAFSDSAPISTGVDGRHPRRHTPALINRAYGRSFFWDGRIDSLEDQVLKPITNPVEMNLSLDELVARLRSESRYVREFRSAFDETPSASTAAGALATYIRVQRFGDSPFDRYEWGQTSALSTQARRGLALFRGRANCSTCHAGPNFSDEKFHNTGVAWVDGRLQDDGRFTITGRAEDRGAFKTPTLREIARTAPYMHDGSLASLADVIKFYDEGGRPNPALDSEVRPLRLSPTDASDLAAFLRALNANAKPRTHRSIAAETRPSIRTR